jgi:O-methyltransferase involved in polyketide biosynthesis
LKKPISEYGIILLLSGGKLTEERLQNLSDVSKTLLIPLWARCRDSDSEHPIFFDEMTLRLQDFFGFDFSSLDNLGQISRKATITDIARRSRLIDTKLKQISAGKANLTVINLGCGLDTIYPRLGHIADNWYDVDLPEVIALRREFFSENGVHKFISADISKADFLDEIELSENTIILSEGTLMYLKPDSVKLIFQKAARKAKNLDVIFEAGGSWLNGTKHPAFSKMRLRTNYIWGLSRKYNLEILFPGFEKISAEALLDSGKDWGFLGKIAAVWQGIKFKIGSIIIHLKKNQ